MIIFSHILAHILYNVSFFSCNFHYFHLGHANYFLIDYLLRFFLISQKKIKNNNENKINIINCIILYNKINTCFIIIFFNENVIFYFFLLFLGCNMTWTYSF